MNRAGIRWLLAALALPCAAPAAAGPASPAIRAEQGEVTGVWQGDLRVFKGLPYALPPVGERRWRPPAPAAAWKGRRDASAFGPACVQPPYPAASVYFEPAVAMSEDCLTLNIWAPKQAKKAPVIVWIHGGALTRGTSGSAMYDGGGFARRGVVFVSINYRLGVFGWLAHPALSAESAEGVSGNYGLLDQIAALRWVRANIARAGGDPDNVTVMGESAGALSITYLLTSPRAKGLFDRAILQSANIRAVPRLREPAFGMASAEATGAALGETVGARTLGALRALDAKALVAAGMRSGFVAQGTVDGAVLPEQVVEVLDRGGQARVPILAGFNSGEVRSQRVLVPAAPASAAIYTSEIERRYQDLAPEFLRLYPASNMGESLIWATRDAVYGWATERLVRAQTDAGQPAWMFLFDHCYAAARARDLCAFHASELPFAFGPEALRHLPPNWPVPDGDDDRALAGQMIDLWVAFARTGRPGPDWPAYGADQSYAHFGAPGVFARDPLPGMFELQDEVVRRRRQRGQQWLSNIGPAAPLPD